MSGNDTRQQRRNRLNTKTQRIMPDETDKIIELEHQVERLENDLDRTAKDALEAQQGVKALTQILGKLLKSYSLLHEMRPVTFLDVPQNDPEILRRNLMYEASELLDTHLKKSK